MTIPIRILKGRRRRAKPLPTQEDPRGRSVPLILDPEAPQAAPVSLLVGRYPTALDTVPTIVDNDTPLSGIFHNYLALMLEACMAELGIYPEMPGTLLEFLGLQFANRVSNWRSFNKTFGGNEAGQIFGLIKQQISRTAAGYANEQQAVPAAVTHQGHHPSLKQPALFAEVVGIGITAANMIAGIGGGVRGEVTGMIGTAIFHYNYRGSPGGPAPAASAGSFVQPTNILLAFLVEAS